MGKPNDPYPADFRGVGQVGASVRLQGYDHLGKSIEMLRSVLQGGMILAILIVVGLALRSILAKPPERFAAGVREIVPCPGPPSCVSSRATDPAHRVDSLAFEGPPDEILERLEGLVNTLPRTRVVTATNSYLHAECTSRIFRFIDDLELLFDPEDAVIQIRSASRVGYSDFGVNRRRVEKLRALLSQQSSPRSDLPASVGR